MKVRAVAALSVLALVVALTWILIPPFPTPMALIGSSLASLTAQLGSPREVTLDVPAPLRPAQSVEWSKTRVVAIWTVQADWQKAPASDSAHPDMVSRCLRPRGAPEWVRIVLFLPCDTVFEGRVTVSNNRLERSRVTPFVSQEGSR